ncbi:heme-binding protein [Bradyrhizobium sp. CCGUVB1N3]|uniref:GlcG/HbpS family heme-binding protein n=1 Tax=Bradyrhizobium sp. CCGUVB1N3 TaxID=2949629 RepID=UPI0020B2B2CC|nr:heme-binding protein [Bradyrhizobium sp. CCGUVB1N3]MCP3474595.1 heme-binding protein [Bradyrhizobium sp. CCGUVB1N3]
MSNTTPSQKSIAMASINRDAAVALIDASIAAAKAIGIDAAVAVIDATGNLRAFERTDGAPFLTVDVAIDKAWTASSFGFPTHVWNDYVTKDPKVAPLAYRPRMVAVGGGYPIIENGKLIGGVGISGGTYQQDQDACVAALEKLGFEVPA